MTQVHTGRSPMSNSLRSVLDPHSSHVESPSGPLPFSSLGTSASQSSNQPIINHFSQPSQGSSASVAGALAPGAAGSSAGPSLSQATRRPPTTGSSGGGNTELRAQIRKEREAARNGSKEAEKTGPIYTNSGSNGSNGASTSHPLPASDPALGRKQSATASSSSGQENNLHAKEGTDASDKQLTEGEDDDVNEQPRAHPATQLPPQWTQPYAAVTSGHERAQTQPLNIASRAEGKLSSSEGSAGSHFVINPKRLSTGSAVAAAVRKLEEDAKAHMSSHQPMDYVRGSKERRSEDRPHVNFSQSDGYLGTKSGSSGPPESYDQSFGMEALQAAFSAKYYELASKCKNWERYAAKLRAQAEALEAENRLLRETSSKQEDHILILESENNALKDQSALRENRAREVESRLSSLEQRLSHSHVAQQRSQLGSGPPFDHLQDLRSALEAAYIAPSPPNTSGSQDVTLSGPQPTGAFHSSNLMYSDDESRIGQLRAPTPLTSTILPYHAQKESQTFASNVGSRSHHPTSRNPSGNTQRDSIVAYDAANRDHGEMYGEGRASRLGNRTHENLHGIQCHSTSASMTEYVSASQTLTHRLPVLGSGVSTALTSQALAAFDHQHHHNRPSEMSSTMGQIDERAMVPQPLARLRPSQAPRLTASPARTAAVAGQKRSTVDPPQSTLHPSMPGSHSQPTISRQISGTLPKVRNNNSFDPDMMRSSASLPTLPLASGESGQEAQATHVAAALHMQYLQAQSQLHARVRSGSAISDAGTVTGWPHSRAQTHSDLINHSQMPSSAASSSEYLAEQASQRRRLRRTSMSQQQQLAQIQAQREATGTSSDSGGPQPPSRSASRSSNMSGDGTTRRRGSKTRSRAGSASVHDSIPIIKDDIFSDGRLSALDDPSSRAMSITHSQSHPSLGSQGRSVSLGPHGPPPAHSNGMGRVIQPLMPLGNITNTHQHQRSSGSGSEHYRASTSDGALHTLKPGFGRTASGSSLASQSSASQQTSSSGQLAHQSSNISQASSYHAPETSSSSTEGLAQIDEELTAEAKRGAHRRLYIALREELPEAELSKFERYVHRYDALEIPLDGPRGLVNRVKKLLILSDPTLKDRPAEMKRRKDLAREFERIVRVDTE